MGRKQSIGLTSFAHFFLFSHLQGQALRVARKLASLAYTALRQERNCIPQATCIFFPPFARKLKKRFRSLRSAGFQLPPQTPKRSHYVRTLDFFGVLDRLPLARCFSRTRRSLPFLRASVTLRSHSLLLLATLRCF
jgi:hypothetical protein